MKLVIIKKTLLFVITCLFLGKAVLFAGDLIYTKSAHVIDEGKLTLAADLYRYAYHKAFLVNYINLSTNVLADGTEVIVISTNKSETNEHATYEMVYLPIRAQVGIVRFFQFDFTLPLVGYRDLATERIEGAGNDATFYGFSVGDILFDMRIRWDKIKSQSSFNLGFSVQVPNGIRRVRAEDDSLSRINIYSFTNKDPDWTYDTETIKEYDYMYSPLSRGVFEWKWFFYYTQEWFRDFLTHLNVAYVYETEEGEKFWQPEPLFAFREHSKTKARSFQFLGFGLDDLFRKLFWVWSKEDPWKYKRNDRLEIGFSLEYFFQTPLTLGKFKLDLAYKIFLELNANIPFSEYSSFSRELVLTPGIWIRVTRFMRFLFGYSVVIKDTHRRFYNKRIAISARFTI